ncbi:hypothetical protein HMPREF3025_04950 [Neisseria sp. HMSC070E12]|nr:hypothetical protein HMPREF2638_04025 [Neisseria sp. HMSC055F11]OHR43184.1 hypothetical protein HMPREF3025_04950 [Neisseria sp. HMSC070E12]
MWIAVNRQDGRNGLGDSGFLSIQVLLDRLPINHLLQLQQRKQSICWAIMACVVCRKKMLIENPLNVLMGI